MMVILLDLILVILPKMILLKINPYMNFEYNKI